MLRTSTCTPPVFESSSPCLDNYEPVVTAVVRYCMRALEHDTNWVRKGGREEGNAL